MPLCIRIVHVPKVGIAAKHGLYLFPIVMPFGKGSERRREKRNVTNGLASNFGKGFSLLFFSVPAVSFP